MTRSNAYSLLCVAIRAVVLWFLFETLVYTASVVMEMRRNSWGDLSAAGWVLAAPGLAIVVLVLAWIFADKLARLTLARPQEPIFESSLEPQAWLSLAISIIGAWLLFSGLRDTAGLTAKWLMIRGASDALVLEEVFLSLKQDALEVFVQLVIATVCLLQAPGLTRLIHRWRYGEQATQSANPD